MKRLIITRHAQAEFKDGVLDFDRDLDDTGVAEAAKMAFNLKKKGVGIDKILYSSSQRTTSTMKIINESYQISNENLEAQQKLYLAIPRILIEWIKETDDSVKNLMLIAHNPGISDLMKVLTNGSVGGIPTCGMVSIMFDINSWSEVSNNGKLGFFIYPKMYK
jgi:phosphohistidine phosphatase